MWSKLGCLGSLIVMALLLAVSYFVTCGLIYLVFLCFAWEFSWMIATGVWLVLILFGSFFSR